MAKFCKWFLIFIAVTTFLPCLMALLGVLAVVLVSLFGKYTAIGFLLALVAATLPGTVIALVGVVLGWIGAFFGKLILSIISVLLISLGVAAWLTVFYMPWAGGFTFVILLTFGIICLVKQRKHNKYEGN